MASEEQLNNQERSNDLQRESNELLKDYNSGILESADFVNVLTSRTSQLVDFIRDANREKGKTLKADRDLTSSVTKIADLTKNLSTPYTDMGKAIRDSNKATDLLSRSTKDLVLVETNLGEVQLKGVNDYMAAKQKEANLEQSIANKRKNLTSAELKAADSIIEKRRQSIEAERQLEKFQAENNLSLKEYNDMQASIADKVQKEANAKAKLQSAQDQYNADVSKQIESESALLAAENSLATAKKSGDQEAINAAKELVAQKQAIYDQDTRAVNAAEKQVSIGKSRLNQAQDSFTEQEKELQLRQKAYDTAEKDRQVSEAGASERAKSLVNSQHQLDVQRDIVHDKEAALNADQKAYMAGKQSIEQLEATIEYLDEEQSRVRGIVHTQTLWNASLGAVEGLMTKIGLGSQAITVGLDEGKKAAQSMAEELVATRREAIGAAADAKREAEEAIAALAQIEQEYKDAIASGDAARMASAEKARSEAKERAKTANEQFASAEAASKKANSLVSKIGDSFKVLGAGLKGTFKGMASELKALGVAGILIAGFKKAFKFLGGNVVTGFISDLKGKFTEGIDYIKNEFFSLDSYIADAKAGETFMQQMSQYTADLATNLGVSTSEAKELEHQARKVSREIGMMPEELAKTTGELMKAFGTTEKFSTDTVKAMGQLTHQYGLSNEEAAQFVKMGKLSGEEARDVANETKAQIAALKERNNVAISEKEVMKEIANSTALQRMNAEKFAGGIAGAAFQAKKMGLELSKVEGISSNLLNFEDSIAKEMEAELLLGRDLQLDKARQLALQGDLAGVGREVLDQVGSYADFANMNVMQQQALADSVGLTRDELAKTLETQNLLADSGFDDMSQAQEAYRKALKETGSEEKAIAAMKAAGAKEGIINQVREVSYAEKRKQQERDLVEQQLKMAEATNKLFTSFDKIRAQIKEIKGVIVTAMKPFFDSFGKTVGEGGDAFRTMVLPYAKKLGEFMNDVGLRLVDIVRNNGPQIKAVFSGVLNVFGAIYGKVGELINYLLGVKKEGNESGSVFDRISATISNIVEYIKNIDVAEVVAKVKDGFGKVKDFIMNTIEAVKPIFNFISKKIGAVTGLFKENPGLTKVAGLSSLAVTMAPGLIGDLGAKIKDKAVDGLKSAGKGIGNKITESLGLGKLFGSNNKKPTGGASDPLYVQNVGESARGGLMDMVGKMGGRQAGIGGGFKKGWKGLFDYAKMALKPGRAGQVGRARLLRAGKGLLTGQGASFVGGTGKGAAQAAGKLAGGAGKIAGAAGKLGKVAGSLGKIAAGGGIGAIVGLAAEASLGVFQKKAEAAAGALDEQIAMTDDAGKAAELEAERTKKLRAAQNLEIAGTTAKYAGLGATIGSVIPGVGTAVGAAVGAVAGFTVGMIKAEKERKYQASKAAKFQQDFRRIQLRNAQDREQIQNNYLQLELQKKQSQLKESLKVQQQFASELKGIDLEVPLDGPNEAFESLAQEMLDAGKITREEFTSALNGTITPLDLMNAAASRASENLGQLYDAVGEAAEAAGRDAAKRKAAEMGTSEEIIASQQSLIDNYKDSVTSLKQTDALFKQFESDLVTTFDDAEATEVLSADSGPFKDFATTLAADIAQGTGQGSDKVASAMDEVLDELKNNGDFQLDSAEDVRELQNLIIKRLEEGVQYQSEQIIQDRQNATLAAQEFGLKYLEGINQIQTQLASDNEGTTQRIIDSLSGIKGLDLDTLIGEDGALDTNELQDIKVALSSIGAEAAGKGDQATVDAIVKAIENLAPQTLPTPTQDKAFTSQKGPFTITDRDGQTTKTAAGDGLVVSPNITVDPGVKDLSPAFGKLSASVSKNGVHVQDAIAGILKKDTKLPFDPFSTKKDNTLPTPPVDITITKQVQDAVTGALKKDTKLPFDPFSTKNKKDNTLANPPVDITITKQVQDAVTGALKKDTKLPFDPFSTKKDNTPTNPPIDVTVTKQVQDAVAGILKKDTKLPFDPFSTKKDNTPTNPPTNPPVDITITKQVQDAVTGILKKDTKLPFDPFSTKKDNTSTTLPVDVTFTKQVQDAVTGALKKDTKLPFDPFSTKKDNTSTNPPIDVTITKQVQDAVAGDFEWKDDTVKKVMKNGSYVPVTASQLYSHLKEFGVLGLRPEERQLETSGASLSNFLSAIKKYIGKVIKGDFDALYSIMNPWVEASFDDALKGFSPIIPDKRTHFYPAKAPDPSMDKLSAFNPHMDNPQRYIEVAEKVIASDEEEITPLATGGIVQEPIKALVGEAGPEAVIPLDEIYKSNEATQKELKELKEIMGGFVQQMAQVVNRPVVVELDGNKVGESIGRNSFLVQ